MKSIKPALLALSLVISALSLQPAQAAIQRSADFSEGHSVGIGLYGLSYDYGIGFFSAGLVASSAASFSLGNPFGQPIKPGLRLLGRFYQQDGLSAGVLGGLTFDPGNVGDRAYLTPDLGLGVAYDFKQFNVPVALRLNISVALGQSRSYSYYPGEDPQPQGNLFQRLMFGPNTSLELAWMPTDKLEVTLGGGTILGMRMKF